MATEFRLGYTGAEINQKLAKVDEIEIALENEYYTSTDIDTKIDEVNTSIEGVNASINEVNTSIEEVNTSIETSLQAKADLVDGKVPLEQLPDDIGSGGGLTEVFWKDIKDAPFGATVGSIVLADNLSFTSFDVSEEGLLYGAQLELNSYETGEKASVLFDGVSYELTRKYSEELEGYYFGNGSVLNVMDFNFENTNEPFMLSYNEEDGGFCAIYLTDTQETTHTISASVLTEVIKTLDLKYLPENMALGYEEKPFDDITWDGNATDKEMVTVLEMEMPEDEGGGLAGYYLVKISDTPIANASDVIGGYIQKYLEGQVYEPDEITSDIVISDNNCWWLVSDGMSYMVNVTSLPASIDLTDAIGVTVELPSTGVYFIGGYINRDFTTPMEYTVALKPNSKIVTIDPKFIPADLDFNLDDYYTKNEVDAALGNIDLSGYYTKDEVDNIIGDVGTVLDEIDALIGE